MLKEEGVSAFWKGHAAGQLLSISYGAVQFGMYPVALSAITVRSGWAEPFHVCGGGEGHKKYRRGVCGRAWHLWRVL